VAFGDGGSAESVQQQVANQMANWINSGHRADALVEAGDNVYPDGDPSRFSAALDVPYSAIRSQDRPLWVALGNHDTQAGHGAEQLAYLGLPTMPYAKTITGAQILFLDANNPDAAQAAWLETQLSAPGPALRIVVFHQPAYSCATHGSTALVKSLWVPIIEAHRVALVINGHDHYYERFRSSSDVTYVVTGGGGYALYARKSSCTGTPPSQATVSRHHFVGIEIAGSRLRLTAVARTGETLDQTTITR
jgi:3',5'-cyclic AMP phosphodiesterase CpdA